MGCGTASSTSRTASASSAENDFASWSSGDSKLGILVSHCSQEPNENVYVYNSYLSVIIQILVVTKI
ncbi:hypothetical protein MPLSOD_140622 [Mesorhizobium sp. SOD10]|nr:hypothetical protein MPLSOD_140622 [Mesorhizobium sp. SOD10]